MARREDAGRKEKERPVGGGKSRWFAQVAG